MLQHCTFSSIFELYIWCSVTIPPHTMSGTTTLSYRLYCRHLSTSPNCLRDCQWTGMHVILHVNLWYSWHNLRVVTNKLPRYNNDTMSGTTTLSYRLYCRHLSTSPNCRRDCQWTGMHVILHVNLWYSWHNLRVVTNKLPRYNNAVVVEST